MLSLDHFEEVTLPDVHLEQFQEDGDAQAFAEAYIGFFKAAFEPCLFVSLSDRRTPQNRQQVIDLFSERLQLALRQILKILLSLAVAADAYLEKAKVEIA